MNDSDDAPASLAIEKVAAAPAAMRFRTSASQAEPSDGSRAAEARALHEVVELLARQEASSVPKRTAQIRSWVNETAAQFDDAPIKTYIPILVEHIVRTRMYRTPAQT